MKEKVEQLLPRDLRSEKQLYMSGRKDVRKREIFSISRQTIHRPLKNIGFTRKKRPMDTKKEMRKSDLNLQRL